MDSYLSLVDERREETNVMDSKNDDYVTLHRLAMYLEASWSDFLIEPIDRELTSDKTIYPNPRRDCVTPDFFVTWLT